MEHLKLTEDNNVFKLKLLSHGEGATLTPEAAEEWKSVLRRLHEHRGPGALLIYSDDPKVFHIGLDLSYLSEKGNSWIKQNFTPVVDQLLGRIATIPMPTVAAVNGHAYGIGALLAIACDFRLMNKDRGFICFPEINLGIPMGDNMQKLIRTLPDQRAAKELLFMGRPIDADEALRLKVIDRCCRPSHLNQASFDLARSLAKKDRATFLSHKKTLRPEFQFASTQFSNPSELKPVRLSA